MRGPSGLSDTLIARKGRAWPGEIAADAVMRDAAAGRPRRRMVVAFGLGALALAVGSGVFGYRAGIEQASRQDRLASAPAAPASPPDQAANRAPDRTPPAAAMPAPLPESPVGAAMEDPPYTAAPDGPGVPAKPAVTYAVASVPPGNATGEPEGWVDITAALDSMPAVPRPAPPPAAVRAASRAAVQVDRPAPPPREKPAAGDGFRIQLSALASEAAARREWRRLKRSHGVLLDGRRPIVVRGRVPGAARPVYRLQLASFASRAAARSFCQRARSRKLDCMIVVR